MIQYVCERCNHIQSDVIYRDNHYYCQRCYEALQYTPIRVLNNISNMILGHDYDQDKGYELLNHIKDLVSNEAATRNSISNAAFNDHDVEFAEWFMKNCQGYSDIERDVAYAAWKAARKSK